MKKKKLKTDGLGAVEIEKVRSAIRLVWQRSHARKLAVTRCIGLDGFYRCEKCNKKTPQIKIDHIERVGDVDEGFVKRLFCPSSQLQGLCKVCHDAKTKEERKVLKSKVAVI